MPWLAEAGEEVHRQQQEAEGGGGGRLSGSQPEQQLPHDTAAGVERDDAETSAPVAAWTTGKVHDVGGEV